MTCTCSLSLSDFVGFAELCGCSSQSVARLNMDWSNEISRPVKRRRSNGGFAGRDDLERTRRYRDEDDKREQGGYGMVFDVPEKRRRR